MMVFPARQCLMPPKEEAITEKVNPVPIELIIGSPRIFNNGVIIKLPPTPKKPLNTPILNPIKINKIQVEIELKSNVVLLRFKHINFIFYFSITVIIQIQVVFVLNTLHCKMGNQSHNAQLLP